MKKIFAVVFCAALLAASASAMTKEEEDAAWKKEPAYGRVINVGYNGGLCNGPSAIADIKGFYAEEGLKINIMRVPSALDAIGTGKVDMTCGHISQMLVPAVNGVRMIFTSGQHTGCKSLYVSADSPFKATADLVGKTVAIPDGIGASDQNISMRFFNHDGIDPRQVKWKVVEAGVAVMAMKNGEVQAALLSDQFARKFLDRGELRIIRSLTFDEDFKQEPCCIYAVNLDFYNANPITVKKMNRAEAKARHWIMENVDESVRVLQEHNYATGDFDLVLSIQKTLNYDIDDKATGLALRNIIDDYKNFGMIDAGKDTDELLKRVWDPVLQHD